MPAREIRPGVHWVGAIDWDREIFDELIPLPDGTSYNAYLVRGSEKTALIDTVDPTKTEELIGNLDDLGVTAIDYIVANHAEQDHSGSLPAMLERFPGATVVTNEKCRGLLVELLQIPEDRVRVIQDGETLPLGDRTLQFFIMPWVHWPETMVTYLQEDRVLFSCDFFGSHYATSNLFVGDEAAIHPAAKRYYAEIMMPFRKSIQGHLARLDGIGGIDIIAPSHGPLHDRPSVILDAYRDWTGDTVRDVVVLPYVSMHGSTREMVDHLIGALIGRGVTVKPFNLPRTDLGDLAMAIVDAATIVVGTPTVIFGPHPAVVSAAYVTNLLRPKTRYVTVIGSYGWGGKAADTIAGMLDRLRAEVIEPVIVLGKPGKDEFAALDRLADEIVKRHRDDTLVLQEER
ncbi:FprA family A-type flavoprotein [Methanoculleus sp. FWC-SCC1]|uniref:FprA family A-type flavoprotein n=1 Tax=Methanoculleus frigidifontis TaxID=2584085 RepID=A0ABT8MCA0_9EURY|nr:FprA family A-type flavoprotein [Methanoculleus sp. FWC-SCC1]MDN7025544.1 FprA family A-type flavoprotein [Methanoculleus sp. FWC-SCC1]